MRVAAILLACLFSTAARADDKKPAPVPQKKPIQMGTVEINGHRDVPVGIVLTRDETAKRALDSSIDEHVRDAVRGSH